MNRLDKIATHPLQTSAWAEFRRKWGNEVLETKYGILTLHKIPLSNYKIAIFEKGSTPTKPMLADLKKLGNENKFIFIKLEPNIPKSPKLTKLMKSMGAVTGRRLFTPTTFQIDLTPSEDELMKSFSPKTRYNIRLAERRGVKVKEDNSEAAFNKYLELTAETVHRQGFFAHSRHYHQLMWKVLRKAGIAHLLTATYKGKIITTWILFVWKNFLYYPYGASTEKYKQSLAGKTGKNVMANNLIMWEAIRFGRNLKLKTFDLWGREEGKGFTKFKEGYNPKVVEFLGTWDLIINKPLYWLYRIAEWVRWPTLKVAAKFGLSKHRF
jgi:lipid II:glycine glycyltransferase (peptidoglycan interpeptide bridge formation enzyme)